MSLTGEPGSSVTVSDDSSASGHLIAGECIGSFLITPDGNTQASGHCARMDKDGDVLNEEWIQPASTESKGTWRHVGGTGKFKTAAGSGSYDVTTLPESKSAVRWTGDCD